MTLTGAPAGRHCAGAEDGGRRHRRRARHALRPRRTGTHGGAASTCSQRELRKVSRARISATCGTNVAATPGDPRGETTLTRGWPAGQTSMSYRFPRDVSRWCRLDDQSGSIVAFGRFPGVAPGARELITETANNWARVFASSAQACNDYTGPSVCEQVKRDCQGKGCRASRTAGRRRGSGQRSTAARRSRESPSAATERPPRSRTPAGLETLQLRRTATGEWLIDKLGPIGAGVLTSSGPSWTWARRVSNLRPLACEASALPLSYAPQRTAHSIEGRQPRTRTRTAGDVPAA